MNFRSSLVGSSILLAFAATACGGSNPPPAATPNEAVQTADAGAPSAPSATPAATTPAPATTAEATPPPPPPPAGSKKITVKHDPAWAACHASFKAKSKDLAAEVGKLAQGCAALTKMKLVGTHKGSQSESSPHQEFKLKGAAGHCYRVYAESEATIKDLDLLLKDSAGDIGAEDSTEDTNPVLVEDGAFCFKDADDAVVILSVGQGKGNYALQIWGD